MTQHSPNSDRAISHQELLEWLEDVAEGAGGARAVTLLSDDASGRRSTLRAFYRRMVSHGSLGGAWPVALAFGAIVPRLTQPLVGPPPGAIWLAVSGSPHAYIEMAQLVDQLEQLRHFPHLDPWINQAAAGEFRAVLSHATAQSPGDAAALAFAFLDAKLADRVTGIANATRLLDEAVSHTRLGRDAGALGLDGPRVRARALVTAGWLQRLAIECPIALVVDEAHRAGPFLVELVRAVLASPGRVLVVLAGEAARRDTTAITLGGLLGAVPAVQVPALSLANDANGKLAAALALVEENGLFIEQHARLWARELELGDHRPLLAELTTDGWIRPVTSDVYSFATTERLDVARRQGTELLPDQVAARVHTVCQQAVATTTEDDEITFAVATSAFARNHGATAGARWSFAAAIAVRGQLALAERIGREDAASAGQRATLALWRSSAWPAPLAAPAFDTIGLPSPATPDPDELEAMVISAASPATRPEQARARLAPILHALDAPLGLRIAAARVLLAIGDLDGAATVIGADATSWLSEPALVQLDGLTAFRGTPGLVARSVEVMANLHAIAVLRRAMPDSLALGQLLLARLELLERYGRIETAADAAPIAAEAVRIFGRTAPSLPFEAWRAQRWAAWVRLRHGDVGGVAELERIVIEQVSSTGDDDPITVDSRLWLGRSLLLVGRADDAHEVLHEVRRARERTHLDNHPDLLAARHWHAASKVAAGDHRAAIDELAAIAQLRETVLSIDDEDLLAGRHLLGQALAAAGRWSEALDALEQAFTRRSALDLPDAPRLLSVRYSRAVCLTFLQRSGEAIAELDEIIALAETTPDVDGIVVKARNTRGVTYLMSGAWKQALIDLDQVVAERAAHRDADDEVLLCARQQRAECLRWLGRRDAALAEVDEIVRATRTWASDHALVATVREQRRELLAQG